MRWFVVLAVLSLILGGIGWWGAREDASVDALEQAPLPPSAEEGSVPALSSVSEPSGVEEMLPTGERQALPPQRVSDAEWLPWQADPAIPAAAVQSGQVVVQVVDPEGFAVPTYPVELIERSAPGGEAVEQRVLAQGRTNERGWLAFDAAGLQATSRLGTEWQAVAGLAWQRDSRVRIDRQRADEQIWTLEIPTGGVVRVELQQLDGTPYDEDAYVATLWEDWRRNAIRGVDGAYWMHDLPFGLDLAVQVWPDDEWPKQWVPGCWLSARTPCVSRVVRVGETSTVILGRLLGPDGSPLAARAFWLQERERANKAHHRTDAAGRFELALKESLPEELEVSVGVHQIAEYRGRLALPDLQSGEHRDLGDVMLEAQPCLAAGVLRRRDGKPTGMLYVHVAGLDEAGERVEIATAPSSTQGHFFVPGTPPAGSVQVWVESQHSTGSILSGFSRNESDKPESWCLPEPTWVPAGQRGLVLTLVEAVKIRWALPGAELIGLRARCVYESGRIEDLKFQGIFLFQAISPGRAHWEFFVGEDTVPFWTTQVADWSSESETELEAVRTELVNRLEALDPIWK